MNIPPIHHTALWNRFWHALQPTHSTADNGQHLREALIARYSEPHRAYHTTQHLNECLALFVDCLYFIPQPEYIFFALWYHDAVYDTKSHHNEADSAQLAATHLSANGIPNEKIQRIIHLISITAHHHIPATDEEKIIVDMDLAILGADEKRFVEYEQQIRKEYSFVPDTIFRTKRTEILQGFLNRPRIYGTAYFFDRLESRARCNLRTLGTPA
jgi:predicted metal-dependent HD superfamily phosphohydrolase